MIANNNSFWSRTASSLLGFAMFAGAWLVIFKTSTAFYAVNIILGFVILFRGLAGIITFYLNRVNNRLKEKTQFAWSMFLLIIGLVYLTIPGMMGNSLKWRSAVVFAVIAARYLWLMKGYATAFPKLIKFGLFLNVVLLALSVLILTLDFKGPAILAVFMAAALILSGIDLVMMSFISPEMFDLH